MTRLEILASLVQDAYHQQYAQDSDFFKLEDFKSYCAPFYYEVLQEDFDKTMDRFIRYKLINPDAELVLNPAWYVIKEFDVKKENGKYFSTLPSIFSFNKDINFTSLRAVYPVDNIGDCCGDFAKITAEQCSTLKFLPKSDDAIYWYPISDKIYFERVKCGLKKVSVAHIPNLDSDCEVDDVIVPESYVAEIMTRTYNFMTVARNGGVVDKTNNQNPNRVIQTEVEVKQ